MMQSGFSWSCSKHNLFKFCPLAYFYKYHTASAEYADSAGLAEQKHLISADLWVEQIFRRAFRKTIDEGQFSFAFFKKTLFSFFNRDCAEITGEKWRYDPKSVNIDILYYEESSTEELFCYARTRLEKISANFAENFLTYLKRVEYLRIKHFRQPDIFYIDGIKIWCVPDLIFEEHGALHVLTIFFDNPLTSQHWILRSAVNAKFAENRWKHFRRIQPVSFFMHQDAFPPVYISGHRKELVSLIRNSAFEIHNLESAGIYEGNFANFAKKREKRNCRTCVFRRECFLLKNSCN